MLKFSKEHFEPGSPALHKDSLPSESPYKNLIKLILLIPSFFHWRNFQQGLTTHDYVSEGSITHELLNRNPENTSVRKLNHSSFSWLFISHAYWACLELQNLHSSFRWRHTGTMLNCLYCFSFYTLPTPDVYWQDDQEKHESQSVIMGTISR